MTERREECGPMVSDGHREFCRRQHRVIGHFLALQAWRRAVDCIVLERQHLESFLGLERFKRARQEWLMTDLLPWFPSVAFSSRSSHCSAQVAAARDRRGRPPTVT